MISKTPFLEMKFPDKTDDKIIDDPVKAGALEDLVFYLENLHFLKKEGDSYEIKGKFDQKVPNYPIIHTQEEKNFLEEYRKLRELLFAYADTYSRFTNYDERFYNESQIVSKFHEIGISSQSSSSPSHIRNVSELTSFRAIEDNSGRTNDIQR